MSIMSDRTDKARFAEGTFLFLFSVVGHQPGTRGHGSQHESVDLALAEALDHLQPGPSPRAAIDFNRAGDQHLADPTAAGRHDDGSFLVRNGMIVSSA